MPRSPARLVLLSAALSATVVAQAPAPPASPQLPSSISFDIVAVDSSGRPVDGLSVDDFKVAIDGQPQRVTSVRRVSRGPGAAAAAAARQARGPTAVAAEPTRTVLVVVDETMLRRGEERALVQAATVFLDRLGLEDRVAVVRLPTPASLRVELKADRPVARDGLRAVVGQLPPSSLAAEAPGRQDANRAVVDDDRSRDRDRSDPPEQPQVAPGATAPASEEDTAGIRRSITGLLDLLNNLARLPGRKTVAVFSAGLPRMPGLSEALAREMAAAAGAARSAVYVFGARNPHADDSPAPDFSAFETVAARSGGQFQALPRDPKAAIDRVIQELGACYVLSLDSPRALGDGKPHALRVETAARGVTLRAPAYLAARSDPADEAVAENPPGAQPPVGAPSREAARKADLDLGLSRMTEYVEGYQRAFSGLVAEEDYRQDAGRQAVHLRSDFLLVKLENVDYWVSFRDVFEQDGKPVRDRDERLKRLFLDNANPEALSQVQKIQNESARRNVGPVRRDFNVPLYPLTFLLPHNRMRFAFTGPKRTNVNGMDAWRFEYQERVHPTLIRNPRRDADVEAQGWFVMDPATGAIVETGLDAQDADVLAHLVVRYRSDDALGLWVPAKMSETYTYRATFSWIMGGEATYSNFRRFQVKVDEKIAIPK